MTFRLRQICLVAPQLDPAVQAMQQLFGLAPCHHDPAVGAYGLVNALFVFGHQFVEIVAPASGQVDDSTAVGRFLQRSGGRGGYMAIFDTHDPERRRAHVESLGIRIAHVMDHPGHFWGIQLHPRDCRATMLEFDRSIGNEQIDGAYWPAGPHWQAGQQLERVSGVPWIEVTSPDAPGLAAHWARIIDQPLQHQEGHPVLRFELGAVRFKQAPAGAAEHLSGLEVEVDDPAALLQRGHSLGLTVRGGSVDLCGVSFVPRAALP